MNKLTYLLLLITYPCFAQVKKAQGINFQKGVTWEQVQSKAKAENKLIFIDVYATWCGPCKLMDNEVYTNQKVADFYNKSFVSFKVQMDSTKSDNKEIKKMYSFAKHLEKTYSINALPTYLFFSKDGQLVDQDLGFKNVSEFISLGQAVVNPDKNLSEQLNNYRKGNAGEFDFLEFYKHATKTNQSALQDSILKDYIKYINTLKESDLLNKSKLVLLPLGMQYVKSTDGIFSIAIHTPEELNQLTREGLSEMLILGTVIREEIRNNLNIEKAQLPNWSLFAKSIHKKYPSLNADSIVLTEKIRFAKKTKNWREFAEFQNVRFKTYPVDTTGNFVFFNINGAAWDIFLSCSDKDVLKTALEWSEWSIKLLPNPRVHMQFLDTRANILYKLGRTEEAIKQETELIDWLVNFGKKANVASHFHEKYIETLNKMKANIPTW